MAKIKKVIEEGSIQYPATITDAVKNPNNGKTVTQELSELGSIKSNIGVLSCYSEMAVVVNGKEVTFDNKGWDLYHGGKFYRASSVLSEPISVSVNTSANGIIYFDVKKNTFVATKEQAELTNDTILVGINVYSEVVIYATKYTNNKKVSGLCYTMSPSNEFDRGGTYIPLSQKDMHTIAYNIATTVRRGTVSWNSKGVIVGAGDYYFYNPTDGKLAYKTMEETIYELSNNECLVFDTKVYGFVVKKIEETKIGDVVCLFKDGAVGICGGVWYCGMLAEHTTDKVESIYNGMLVKDGDNKLERISKENASISKQGVINAETSAYRYVYTFDVSELIGKDILVDSIGINNSSPYAIYSSDTVLDNTTLIKNDSKIFGNTLSGFKINIPIGARMLAVAHTSIEPNVYRLKVADIDSVVANLEKANEDVKKELSPTSAYLVRGSAEIKGGVLTIKCGDIYLNAYKTYTGYFYRITEDNPLTVALGSGGTDSIYYNFVDKTLRKGSYAESNKEAFIGVINNTTSVFLNGQCTVIYNGGETYNYISSKDVAKIVEDLGISSDGGMPEFVNGNAKNAYQRLMEWSNGDNMYLIAQLTDIHSGGNEKYKVVGWLSELNKLFCFNVLGNWGDIGLETSFTNGNKEETYKLVSNVKKNMYGSSPWVFCKGNHEKVETEGIASNAIYGGLFNKATQRLFKDFDLSEDGCYGCLDDAVTKTRLIVLNTTDEGFYYGLSNTQLQWLVDVIENVEDNYKIIVATHLCVDDIGRTTDYPSDASNSSCETLRQILKSLANHSSGSNQNTGVSWDFTKKPSVKLVCNLSGDSHFNNYIKRDNVNYIVRQGYGGGGSSTIPAGATKDSFDWTQDCCFDVLAVKSNGTARIFRIGVGGENRDLEFTY